MRIPTCLLTSWVRSTVGVSSLRCITTLNILAPNNHREQRQEITKKTTVNPPNHREVCKGVHLFVSLRTTSTASPIKLSRTRIQTYHSRSYQVVPHHPRINVVQILSATANMRLIQGVHKHRYQRLSSLPFGYHRRSGPVIANEECTHTASKILYAPDAVQSVDVTARRQRAVDVRSR